MHYRYLLNLLTIAGLALSLIVASPATLVSATGTAISSSTGGTDFHPDVAEAPDGSRLIAIWKTDLAVEDNDIRVSTSTNGGATWTNEVVIFDGSAPNYLVSPRIVYDVNGNVHVVFMYGLSENRKVYYRYLPAGSDPTVPSNWSTGQIACTNCTNPDLWADGSGYVYVLYEKAGAGRGLGIRRTSGTSGAWEAEKSISEGGDAARGAIAVTSDGKLHVAYLVADNRVVKYARYNSYSSFGEELRTVISTADAADRPDIYADRADHVHIAWAQSDDVYYAEYANGSLSGGTDIGTSLARRDVTVAADSSSNVYVAWTGSSSSDRFRDIYENRRISGSWQGAALLAADGVARYQQYGKSLRGSVNLVFIEENVPKFLARASGGPITYTVNGGHIALGASAPATDWYFAEGYTGEGFDEYLAILNPSGSTANITITYFIEGGSTETKSFTLAGQRRVQIAVHGTTSGVGRNKAVSARVQSTNGVSIVVERPMYFRYGSSSLGGGHNGVGAAGTAPTWYFAEGYTGSGFDEFLTLQNPTGSAIVATISYFLEGVSGADNKTVNLPANSRTTVEVHNPTDEGGYGRTNAGQGISARVSTGGPGIIAERPMYFTYAGGRDGGHNVIGATATSTTWYFAEGYTAPGFDEFITLQNPTGTDTTATVSYFLEGVSGSTDKTVTLPANSRVTVEVHNAADEGGYGRTNPGQGISARVTANNGVGIIAERPVYFNYGSGRDGGHNVMGATAPSRNWYFATGETKDGFDQFITIQNPTGTNGTATLTYYFDDGTAPQTKTVSLPANSRVTVQSHVDPSGSNPGGIGRRTGGNSVHVSTDVDTVVERPMYFSYSSTFAD